jgi:hypothetical protein
MNKKEITQLEILDSSLTLIQSGKATVVDCMQTYPEHANFLEPLLLTANQVHSDLAPDGPTEAYISTTKIRILNQLKVPKSERQEVKDKIRRRHFALPKPAWAFISLALVLIMFISGIGVSSASANSLPGDTFYPVKRGIEELRLMLTFRPVKEAELLMEYTGERLQEMEELLEIDPTSDLNLALQEYDGMLSRLLEIAQDEGISGNTNILEEIDSGISNHEEVLQRVLEEAPPSAQKGLENAIENSSHGKEVIQSIQEGESPSDLAPGQQKKDSENQSEPADEDQGSKPEDKGKGPKPKDETPEPKEK